MSFTEQEILLFELEAVTSAIDRSNCEVKELMTLVRKTDDLISQLKTQVILDALESGMNYSDIAKILGVSRQSISAYMRRHGAPLRRAGRKVRNE